MPTLFRHAVTTAVGITPVNCLEITAGVRATVIGCNIANVTDFDTAVVNMYVIDETSTQATYARGIIIPPNSTVKVITQGEKLILPGSTAIKIESDTESSVDVTISYVEIS